MTLVVVADPEPSTVWDPPEDLWLVLGLLVAAFATLAVSYMLGYRRRKVHGRPYWVPGHGGQARGSDRRRQVGNGGMKGGGGEEPRIVPIIPV